MPKLRRKRDFHSKSYKNPLFPSKKEGKLIRRILKPKKVGIVVIVLTVLLFFSYLPAFQIENIEVLGNKRVTSESIEMRIQDQLEKRRFLIFNQGSIFYFSKKAAIKAVLENELVETVRVKKRYFDTIKILVSEKQSGLAWSSADKQYYLGLDGVTLREIQQENEILVEQGSNGSNIVRSEIGSGKVPLVYDLSANPVLVGEITTSEEAVNFILKLFDELAVISDVEVSHFNIERPFSREIIMVTKEGWEARFKITENPVAQARILASILEQKITNRSNLEYIDLRFGEKVYYK